MRKLASIQKIISLHPIEGADNIVKATVLGWQLVVKKDEFKIGDLVVYCETDSVMPDKPEFIFLKPRGMRITTIRLRGQISQGLCLPLTILPHSFEIYEGADCTETLEIVKYEPSLPACLGGNAKGPFPSFIPKTDETRVQVLQDVLNYYNGYKCYITEKLDGSSATFYIKDGEFGACSRNLDLMEDEHNSFWKVARELNIKHKLKTLGKNIAIQGELVGEGIQSNKLKIKGQVVKFFSVFDIEKEEYLTYNDMIALLADLNLPMVPVITDNYLLENDINALIKMATIKSQVNKDTWAEGVVIRPLDTIKNSFCHPVLNNNLVSFKAINPEFLLKYGE